MATTNLTYKLSLDIPSPNDANGNPTGLDINRNVQTVLSAIAIRRSFVGTFVNPGDAIALTSANLGSNPQFLYCRGTKPMTLQITVTGVGSQSFFVSEFLWTLPLVGSGATAFSATALAGQVPCDCEIIVGGPV